MQLRICLCAAILFCLAGCVSDGGEIGKSPDIQAITNGPLPAPNGAVGGRLPSYLIAPYDKLIISVFGIEELQDVEVQVDGAGRIVFPMVGVVQASGKTAIEVGQEIAVGLRRNHVRDPDVAVNFKEANNRFVTVGGQVEKPGQYPILGNMTLLKAVASAQGATQYANISEVIVLREVGGKKYAAVYSLKAVERGNYVDPQLYSDDIVLVGDSPQQRLLQNIIRAAPLISTPLLILFRY